MQHGNQRCIGLKMTMKTIIIATDFSPAAFNAAEYAANLASSVNAGLLLLYVFDMPVSYTEVPLIIDYYAVQRDAETKMATIKEELINKSAFAGQVQTEVRIGRFYSELESVCERVTPYMVVMGSQGTSASERIFFGGHAVYAMKHLQWPLITVPPHAAYAGCKNIGLAFDFEKIPEESLLEKVKGLAEDFNAVIHVLNTETETSLYV